MSIDEKLGRELSMQAKEMVKTHERWSKIVDPSANGDVETIDDVFLQAGSWHAEIMFRESDQPLVVVFPERAPLDHEDGYITSSRLAGNKQNWAMFCGLIHRFITRPNGLSLRKVMFGRYGTSDNVSIFNCTEEPKDASHILLSFELDSIIHRVTFAQIPAGLGGAVAYGKFFTDTGKKDLYFYMVLLIRKLPDIMTKTEPDDSSHLWIKIADIVDFDPLGYQQLFEDIQYNENCKYLLAKEETRQARWRQKCEFRKFRHNRTEFVTKARQLFPDSTELLRFRRDYFMVSADEEHYPYDFGYLTGSKSSEWPFRTCTAYQKRKREQEEYKWFRNLAARLMDSVEFGNFLKQHECKDILITLYAIARDKERVELELKDFKSLPGIPTKLLLDFVDHYSREIVESKLIDWLTSLEAKFDQLDRAYAKMTNLYFARLAQNPSP